MKREPARDFFQNLFQHAVQAVHPAHCLPPLLRQLPPVKGRTVVIGCGKASAAMAQALEQCWQHDTAQQNYSGLVVTRYGQALPCQKIEIIESSHPLPDNASVHAAERILQAVRGLSAHDRVIALISGGGSALMCLPAPGISLAEKQQINRALLQSGASISQINCVRKHLSGIKGGQLAAACAPAQLVSYFISDIPGDDTGLIASGPTLPDHTTQADALAIIHKYAITLPPAAHAWLSNPAHETPKPLHPAFTRQPQQAAHPPAHQQHLIASSQHALQAAANWARQQGMVTHILSDCIEGEAREIALMHAAMAQQIVRHQQPFTTPCLLLSGGETSVTLQGTNHGQGRGGRNSEFLLSLALALQGNARIHAMACDTDGIDGSEDNAGATLHPDSLQRAEQAGLRPASLLQHHDSYRFFSALDDLLLTGPTHTNVNDLRAILIS